LLLFASASDAAVSLVRPFADTVTRSRCVRFGDWGAVYDTRRVSNWMKTNGWNGGTTRRYGVCCGSPCCLVL